MKQVVALVTGSADAHVFLAIVLADAYDLQSALKETETAIRLAPESPSAQFSHARILFDLGRTAEARAGLEAACRLAPDMPEPHYYLALLEKDEGHHKDAADLLQTLVKNQPETRARSTLTRRYVRVAILIADFRFLRLVASARF